MFYKEERFNFFEVKINYLYDVLFFLVINSLLDIFKCIYRFFYVVIYGILVYLCIKIMVEFMYVFNFYGLDYLKGVYFEY